LKLYQSIEEILYKDWDPIGVSYIAEVRDEYQSYLPQVFKLALEHADSASIAEYLHWVAKERMGLSSEIRNHLIIAEKIIQLKIKIDREHEGD
jgi:hypothetical protein